MSWPLIALCTLIYVGVAIDQFRRGNAPMAIVYGGYAVANIGMIWALK